MKFPTIRWIAVGLEYTQGENETSFPFHFFGFIKNPRLSFDASHSHRNLATDLELTRFYMLNSEIRQITYSDISPPPTN